MRTTYISHSLPANYSNPTIPLNKTLPLVKKKGGRNYTLLGTSEKNYSLRERIWVGGSAFAKTSLTFGGALLSKNVRDDWKTCWKGKRTCAVYSSANRHYRNLSDNDRTALTSFFNGSKFKLENFKEPINYITIEEMTSETFPSIITKPLLTSILTQNESYKQILIPIFEKTSEGDWKPSVFLMLKNTTLGMDGDWGCITHSSLDKGGAIGLLKLDGSPLSAETQAYQKLMNGAIITIDNCQYKLR